MSVRKFFSENRPNKLNSEECIKTSPSLGPITREWNLKKGTLLYPESGLPIRVRLNIVKKVKDFVKRISSLLSIFLVYDVVKDDVATAWLHYYYLASGYIPQQGCIKYRVFLPKLKKRFIIVLHLSRDEEFYCIKLRFAAYLSDASGNLIKRLQFQKGGGKQGKEKTTIFGSPCFFLVSRGDCSSAMHSLLKRLSQLSTPSLLCILAAPPTSVWVFFGLPKPYI